MELDRADKRLLYCLTQNGRLSYSTLAANTGVSRETAKARIRRMLGERVVLGFRGIYNHPYFGLEFYNVYIAFSRRDSGKMAGAENYFRGHKNVMWTNKCLGKWDYAIVLTVRSQMEMMDVLSEFKARFANQLKEIEFDQIMYEYKYKSCIPAFFGDVIKPIRQARDDSSFFKLLKDSETKINKERVKASIDRTDAKVLETLSIDCRMPLQEIGKRAGISPEIARYRIKRMIESQVITAFWAAINYDILGFHWYRIRTRLNIPDEASERKLSVYLANHPNIFWAARELGRADLHIDLRLRDNTELEDFLSDFNSKFEKIVVDYEALIMTQEHNHDNFTKVMREIAGEKNG